MSYVYSHQNKYKQKTSNYASLRQIQNHVYRRVCAPKIDCLSSTATLRMFQPVSSLAQPLRHSHIYIICLATKAYVVWFH